MSKVILITGASAGFGFDAAETLAKAGHRVFASMRDVAGRNQEKAAALQANKIDVVELDVTTDASVNAAVAQVLKAAGRIDVLINNAGAGATGISEAYTSEQVTRLFDVNVVGVQRTSRAVLPTLRKQGEGLIINIGSVLGRTTLPFLGIYGATKFALDSITQSYRYEVAPFGVEVSLLQPSAYPTDIYTKGQMEPEDSDRIGTYGEVATILDNMRAGFAQMLSGPNAPDSHEVAEALVKLVAEPKGQRPARVIVGTAFGADVLNATAAQVQAQALGALGLGGIIPAFDTPNA
ncbi:SDR family oxidoreductase [Silvibacterium acidisoli]|uniref:SDR family oxidoreductase n=1 Tax=Acidobacteriaceae bacterium ZG23-2 TaxID=2883246 RepID=UPI00406C240E